MDEHGSCMVFGTVVFFMIHSLASGRIHIEEIDGYRRWPEWQGVQKAESIGSNKATGQI